MINILGLILLVILAFGLGKGFMSGLVKQAASIAGVILGVVGAWLFAGILAVRLADFVDAPGPMLLSASYFLIFIAVAIACNFAGKMLHNLVSAANLSGLNRVGGGIAGFLKYAIITGILINFYNSLDNEGKIISTETRQKAVLYYPLQQLGERLLPYVEEFKDNNFRVRPERPEEKDSTEVEI